jgi:hypothetical protein
MKKRERESEESKQIKEPIEGEARSSNKSAV